MAANQISGLLIYFVKRGREIAERAMGRLALLLAGVELYEVLGREFDLRKIMRSFAHDMQKAVENTPTVRDLEQLFDRDPPS